MPVTEIAGVVVYACEAEGPALTTARDATDLIGEAMSEAAQVIVIPVSRLAEEFFQLRTGQAGEILQKFVNYRMQVVILGDIAAHVAASKALHDFVYESNRGRHIWFLASREELAARLTDAP